MLTLKYKASCKLWLVTYNGITYCAKNANIAYGIMYALTKHK